MASSPYLRGGGGRFPASFLRRLAFQPADPDAIAYLRMSQDDLEEARGCLNSQAFATAASAFAAAGDRHCELGAEPVIFSNQFSSFNPFTRWNSRRLSVTSTASTTRAWAEIQRSLAPMGWP